MGDFGPQVAVGKGVHELSNRKQLDWFFMFHGLDPSILCHSGYIMIREKHESLIGNEYIYIHMLYVICNEMRFSLLSSALVRNSIHFSAELSGRDEEWSMKKIVDYMSEAGRMNGSCARPLSEQPWGRR